MSGAFPTSPGIRALNFKDNRPTLLNQTISGKKQVRQIGGQYFSFTITMPPIAQLEAQAIFAFLQKQKGSFENFTISLPTQNMGTSKNETDILVNGVHALSDSTISLDGFSHTNNALRAGDLIKFANHSKVYMIQEDVTASGGAATVSISPNLVATLADNEAVTVNQPPFTVYLESNEIVYTTNQSGLFSISFDVREVIT